MKKILLSLTVTLTGLLSATEVLAGPSVGVVIEGPVYRPAPVYYAPAPAVYTAQRPYYAPAPVVYTAPRPYYAPAPVYYAPAPVVVRAPPRYYAPVVVPPSYYRGHGYYGGHHGHGHGHGHYNRGYYGR